MNCNDIQNLLADYLGRELDPPRLAAFESHLSGCGPCRVEVASLQETLSVMQRLEAPPQAMIAPPRHRARFLQPLAYAAMLLFGVGLGWWLKPPDRQEAQSGGGSYSTTMLASRVGMHRAWVDAAVGATPEVTDSTRFVRNLVTFSRALSTPPQP